MEPTAYSSLVPSPAVFQYGGEDQVKTVDINVICQSAASVTQQNTAQNACQTNTVLVARNSQACVCGGSQLFNAVGENTGVCYQAPNGNPTPVPVCSPSESSTVNRLCICAPNAVNTQVTEGSSCMVGNYCHVVSNLYYCSPNIVKDSVTPSITVSPGNQYKTWSSPTP